MNKYIPLLISYLTPLNVYLINSIYNKNINIHSEKVFYGKNIPTDSTL